MLVQPSPSYNIASSLDFLSSNYFTFLQSGNGFNPRNPGPTDSFLSGKAVFPQRGGTGIDAPIASTP